MKERTWRGEIERPWCTVEDAQLLKTDLAQRSRPHMAPSVVIEEASKWDWDGGDETTRVMRGDKLRVIDGMRMVETEALREHTDWEDADRRGVNLTDASEESMWGGSGAWAGAAGLNRDGFLMVEVELEPDLGDVAESGDPGCMCLG